MLEFLQMMGPAHWKEIRYWIWGFGQVKEKMLTEGSLLELKGGYYGLPGDEKWEIIPY